MRRIGHKEHTASLENGCAVSVKILIRSVLTDNEKFVITVPVNMAAFEAFCQSISGLNQNGIAECMAFCFIDRFKTVEIHYHYVHRDAQIHLEVLPERIAASQIGQFVLLVFDTLSILRSG